MNASAQRRQTHVVAEEAAAAQAEAQSGGKQNQRYLKLQVAFDF